MVVALPVAVAVVAAVATAAVVAVAVPECERLTELGKWRMGETYAVAHCQVGQHLCNKPKKTKRVMTTSNTLEYMRDHLF